MTLSVSDPSVSHAWGWLGGRGILWPNTTILLESLRCSNYRQPNRGAAWNLQPEEEGKDESMFEFQLKRFSLWQRQWCISFLYLITANHFWSQNASSKSLPKQKLLWKKDNKWYRINKCSYHQRRAEGQLLEEVGHLCKQWRLCLCPLWCSHDLVQSSAPLSATDHHSDWNLQ